MKHSLGIVTDACNTVGVSRKTYYHYLKTDTDFKEQIDDIENIALDFVEGKLFENIKKLDTASILFYMKTKGKKRGYIERQEIEHSGEVNLAPMQFVKNENQKDEKD